MANNIFVTLLNKAAFVSVDFQYPYLLSAIHMLTNGFGAYLIFWSIGSTSLLCRRTVAVVTVQPLLQQQQQQQLKFKDLLSGDSSIPLNGVITHTSSSYRINKILGPIPRKHIPSLREYYIYFIYSIVFSLNIAIGNLSLSHVSVNFNQVMRSLVPAITILLSYCMGQSTTQRRILAVIPIVIGVAMATYGDFTFTWIGFIITVTCVILAALKVVASGYLLQGSLKLHPVDLLYKMTPFATAQCFFLSIVSGEFTQFQRQYSVPQKVSYMYTITFVLGSGILAFSLNISSLMANKLTSPLTLCIAANVKQVLIMASSTIIFETPVSFMNGFGIVVVLIGSAIYSYVSLKEDERGSRMRYNKKTSDSINTHIKSDEEVSPVMMEDDTIDESKDTMSRPLIKTTLVDRRLSTKHGMVDSHASSNTTIELPNPAETIRYPRDDIEASSSLLHRK